MAYAIWRIEFKDYFDIVVSICQNCHESVRFLFLWVSMVAWRDKKDRMTPRIEDDTHA